jgi:hypothetical protein
MGEEIDENLVNLGETIASSCKSRCKTVIFLFNTRPVAGVEGEKFVTRVNQNGVTELRIKLVATPGTVIVLDLSTSLVSCEVYVFRE